MSNNEDRLKPSLPIVTVEIGGVKKSRRLSELLNIESLDQLHKLISVLAGKLAYEITAEITEDNEDTSIRP